MYVYFFLTYIALIIFFYFQLLKNLEKSYFIKYLKWHILQTFRTVHPAIFTFSKQAFNESLGFCNRS